MTLKNHQLLKKMKIDPNPPKRKKINHKRKINDTGSHKRTENTVNSSERTFKFAK
jgi:hypothetical protein